MSFDSLPDCVVKCFHDQADSLGCDKDDVQCYCETEVSGSNGPDLSSCVLGECPAEDMLALGMDLLSFCDDFTDGSNSDSSATATGPDTATRTTETSGAERTSEAASSNTSDPRVGDSREGGSNQQSESGQNSGSGQDSGSDGLSTGAKAGIGVGAAIGVILLLLGAFLLGRRKRRGSKLQEPSLSSPAVDEYKGPELEGEKWVPELDGQRNQRPAELEADSPMTHPSFMKQPIDETRQT